MTDTERLDFLLATGATLGPGTDTPGCPAGSWCCFVPDRGIVTGASPRDALDRMAAVLSESRR